MGRRLRCLALALAMWVGLSLASPGTAAALTVEQVKEQMPRLNLFFYEDDYDLSGLTAGEIQAWLGRRRWRYSASAPRRSPAWAWSMCTCWISPDPCPTRTLPRPRS